MQQALRMARRAAELDEVPVGAVLVSGNEILAESWNQTIGTHDPTAHAEIRVLRSAARARKNYRLPDTVLYVTLEPCLMCYGALINARVERLVFGASDKRFGVVNSLSRDLKFNHSIDITPGVLAAQCAALLSDFFKTKRKTGPGDIAEQTKLHYP